MKKKNIVFVGAFNNETNDGSTGGQLFACTSLLNSELSNLYNFIKIDSTSKTVPAPPVYIRFYKAWVRLSKAIFYLIFKKVDSILIFSSSDLSFVEKGTIAILYKAFGIKVLFAPRSGLSLVDYEKSRFMKWFMPLTIKSSDYVICQGESWNFFYQKISNEKIEKFIVINNWIDHNIYNQKTYKELNQYNDTPRIIYIGWMEEYKGINDLLAAIDILNKKGIGFICDIYGNGSLYKTCENFIKNHQLNNCVTLRGWADHETKLKALATADIYVLPSHFEGFPNSLLEAMSSEIAIIATKAGAVEDIVTDEFNGIIAEMKNPLNLSKKLEYLILNPDKRISFAKEAKKTINEKFTIEIAVEKFKKIL